MWVFIQISETKQFKMEYTKLKENTKSFCCTQDQIFSNRGQVVSKQTRKVRSIRWLSWQVNTDSNNTYIDLIWKFYGREHKAAVLSREITTAVLSQELKVAVLS